jgi:hypothetical protein
MAITEVLPGLDRTVCWLATATTHPAHKTVQHTRDLVAAGRLQWRLLDGASQSLREQSCELCRILRYVAFGEKGRAI